ITSLPVPITIPSAIGTKWFYKYTSSSGPAGLVTREIIDTTTDGFREVSVRSFFRDSTQNTASIEYWFQTGGMFYISNSPSTAALTWPLFISSLTSDSTTGGVAESLQWQ